MNTCRSLGILALAALLTAPGSGEAQGIKVKKNNFDTSAYVGGGLSYNNVYSYDTFCVYWACGTNSNYGSGDTGLTLTGGYRFHKFFAVEAGYTSNSSIDRSENVSGLFGPVGTFRQEVELQSYQLNIVAIAGGRYWEVWLKAGAVAWDADSDIFRTDSAGGQTQFSYSNSDVDLLFGLGVGRRFDNNWQVRLDFSNFRIDDELLDLDRNQKAYADAWSLQMIRHFGGERQR